MSNIAESQQLPKITGFRIEITKRSKDQLKQRVRFDLTVKDRDGQDSQVAYAIDWGLARALMRDLSKDLY